MTWFNELRKQVLRPQLAIGSLRSQNKNLYTAMNILESKIWFQGLFQPKYFYLWMEEDRFPVLK